MQLDGISGWGSALAPNSINAQHFPWFDHISKYYTPPLVPIFTTQIPSSALPIAGHVLPGNAMPWNAPVASTLASTTQQLQAASVCPQFAFVLGQ